VFLNGALEATLFVFQPLDINENTWDYALAQYIDPTDALAQLQSCAGGNEYPYPQELSGKDSVQVGDTYHRVGARSNCVTGTYWGVGSISVAYSDGVSRNFQNQMLFSPMNLPGDSGAVAIRDSDNTIAGLLFASTFDASNNPVETFGNPIFLNNWTTIGSFRRRGNDTDLPVLVGPPLPPSTPRRGPPQAPQASTPNGLSGALVDQSQVAPPQFRVIDPEFMARKARPMLTQGQSAPHPGIIPFDLPSLSAGKLYLGFAVKYSASGEAPQWITPPPSPIRSNIPVDIVFIRSDRRVNDDGSLGGGNDYYLCFG
jgi:hypothetical protein